MNFEKYQFCTRIKYWNERIQYKNQNFELINYYSLYLVV